MPPSPRSRLGPYEIISPLGAGGMGEVYRARDTRLDRDVAIKVLPDTFASDPEFRERFEREARAVAALSHPNIVQIHELGADAGHLYAAMELLDGETLRERLDTGPLPLRKLVEYAQQIAQGLAAAHGRGIVHRDLKPENIFVTRDGRVKILDFGLAKVAEVRLGTDVTGAGRVPGAATGAGVVLGTVGYMSPEQVRAEPVDHRTDLFSFGAVLYEMATGRRAFSGASSVETLHAILTGDPLEYAAGPPPIVPDALERIVRHCLEKNPDERFHSARDLAFALQALSGSGTEKVTVPRRVPGRTGMIATAAAAVLVAAAALLGGYVRKPPPPDPVIFRILPPSDAPIASPAVSPDGNQIAFASIGDPWATGDALWIRRPDVLEARKLEGTGGVRAPFWSPDGKSIGFFAAGRLKTIEVDTGRINILCDAAWGYGGAWGPDGTILFSPGERSPILRVSASGGTPSPVTTVDGGRGEEAHRWPQFLPDGRHFLYASWNSTSTVRPIRIGSLDNEPHRTLFEAASAAILAGGDYLLFATEQPARLNAWAFDAKKLELKGQPFQPLADTNVDYIWATADIAASASANTIVYTTGKYRRTRLTWFNRLGQPLGTLGEAGTYFDPALTRDGRHLAIEKHDFERNSGDVWTVDLERGVFSRVTSAAGFENVAVWAPDGRRVAFAGDQGKTARVYVKDGSGAGTEQVVVEGRAFPMDWSPDGRHLLLLSAAGNTGYDVVAYDMELRRAQPLLATPFDEHGAVFSPDGKWVAYSSDESQQRQIYVRSFADPTVKAIVSSRGGSQPQWRRDGRELFYLAPDDTLMAVDIDTSGGRLRAGTPKPLFVANVEQRKVIRNNYVAAPDGQRFLVLSSVERDVSPLVTVLNWRSLLKDRR